jgi:DNA-binding NarL/FixJ family response regulator
LLIDSYSPLDGDRANKRFLATSQRMKILVIDDHALIRDALQGVMKKLKRGTVVLEASDSRQAMETLARETDLSLVLLDLNLPDRDGFLVLADIREHYPGVAVVVLSALQDRAKVMQALDLGAAGYIPKSVRREVSISALQLVFSGGVYLPPELLTREEAVNALPVASRHDRPIVSPAEIGLSHRQLEVLALLMQGKSNKAICRTLQLAEPTVKNHVTAILKALKVTNRTEAVIAVNELFHRDGARNRRGGYPWQRVSVPRAFIAPGASNMVESTPVDTPLVEFFQFIPNERPPRRADRARRRTNPRACASLLRGPDHGIGVRLVCLSAAQLQNRLGRP